MTSPTRRDSLSILFSTAQHSGDVTVRVSPAYLAEQSDPSAGRWFWSYHIRIENRGKKAVQLLSRRWHIVDGRGDAHEVVGEGVVGDTPLIAPGGTYDYVSGCPLTTPTGSMEGSYQMVDENGAAFEAAIPKFGLVGPIE